MIYYLKSSIILEQNFWCVYRRNGQVVKSYIQGERIMERILVMVSMDDFIDIVRAYKQKGYYRIACDKYINGLAKKLQMQVIM